MSKGLWIGTGIAIGLALNAAVIFFAQPSTAAPSRPTQTEPAAPGAEGTTVVATGGGTQNQNDLCWVLTRVKPVKGPERLVLALYRAKNNGATFDLEDVRMIEGDLRVIELKGKEHGTTSVENILKAIPKEERDAILPPKQP